MTLARSAVFALAACLASCSEGAPPPPSARRGPSKPTPITKPTFEERIASLKELERESPGQFRAFRSAWSALLQDALGTPREAEIRERLARLEGEANKAYRELFRPVRDEVRELLHAHRPQDALRRLEAWRVPPELDIDGRPTRDLNDERELVAELCGLDARRRALLGACSSGDLSRDPQAELSGPLKSSRVYVRAEAERALAEVRRARAMQTARLRLAKTVANAPEGRRLFGEVPGTPVPTEERLAGVRPPGAEKALAAARACVEAMAAAPSLDAFQAKLQEGMAILNAAIRAAEWYPVTWYVRAEWKHAFLGDAMGALADLDQSVAQQRNFVEARLARALLLLQLPLSREAVKELRALSRALPRPSRDAAERALARTNDRDFAGAAREVEQAMRLMPDDLAFLDGRADRPRPQEPGWAGEVRFESAHYLIRLELPQDAKDRDVRQAVARGFAAHLEAVREAFPALLPGTPRSSKRAEVLVFADEEAYHEYVDVDPLDAMNQSGGMYFHDLRRIVLHEGRRSEDTLETLAHEAMHEYADAIGARLPTWLSEGIADYASGIPVKDGRAAGFGRVLSGRREMLQSAFRAGWQGVPFETMLKERPPEFYGVMRSLQYSQAWSMVHFFRHAGGGRTAEPFDACVRDIVRGVSPSKAFARAFGDRDLETLQREWIEYVRALR